MKMFRFAASLLALTWGILAPALSAQSIVGSAAATANPAAAPAPADPAPTDALDPEVQAMSDMLDILQGLRTMDGRKRVLTYVTARYGT